MNEPTHTIVRRGNSAVFVAALAAAMLAAGCGSLERTDPAARSNRTTYGAISLVASGDNSAATLTIGDGTIASADGEGAITQPSSQTTTQTPEFSGGIDPISAGINAAAHIGGKAIEAYSSKNGQPTAEGGAKCPCPDGSCPDGSCSDCSDGSCLVPGAGSCTGGSCNQ